MIMKATVSAVLGNGYRVIFDGRVSGMLNRLATTANPEDEPEISVGDTVVVAFFNGIACDGVVLGKVTA